MLWDLGKKKWLIGVNITAKIVKRRDKEFNIYDFFDWLGDKKTSDILFIKYIARFLLKLNTYKGLKMIV